MKDKIKLLMMVGLFALNGVSGAMIPGAVPPAHAHPEQVADHFDRLTGVVLGILGRTLKNTYALILSSEENSDYLVTLNRYMNANNQGAITRIVRKAIKNSLINAGYFIPNIGQNTVSIAPKAYQITEQEMIQAYSAYAYEYYGIDHVTGENGGGFNNLRANVRTISNELKTVHRLISKIQRGNTSPSLLNNYINTNTIPIRIQNIRRAIKDSLIDAEYIVLDAATNTLSVRPYPDITEREVISAYYAYAFEHYGISIYYADDAD